MDDQDLIGLGVVLGQSQTLGFLAARCSASQAETIYRLRTEKIYKRVAEDWREFCPQYLHMSGPQADKIIQLWEEFGAGYFELAQLTRISAETYRAIAPAVSNGVLEINGEEIDLTIENSRKVADAVSKVRRRKAANQTIELSLADRAARLTRLCNTLSGELMSFPAAATESFEDYCEALRQLDNVLTSIRQQQFA
jgi:hypothetical protein